jgi:hypothetical protein
MGIKNDIEKGMLICVYNIPNAMNIIAVTQIINFNRRGLSISEFYGLINLEIKFSLENRVAVLINAKCE